MKKYYSVAFYLCIYIFSNWLKSQWSCIKTFPKKKKTLTTTSPVKSEAHVSAPNEKLIKSGKQLNQFWE